ncbi:MAG TPA: hypothetical protein VMN78_02365 [Longimicrobiales bacterium]|nr:hypothetical protein [Longimicrobiales bacterium]
MTMLRLLRPGIIAALLPLVACDDAGMRGLASNDRDNATRAEYAREMIFVADDATAAAVLDFATVDAGSTLRRSAHAWAEAGSGWTPLYDLSWEDVPMRRAWRLVPHGPLRLRVGLEDDIEALMVRDEDGMIASLEPGGFISEWTPFRTAQVVLREATLALGGEPVQGWLVDARFGVSLHAAEAEANADVGPNGVVPPGAAMADTATGRAQAAVDTSTPSPPAEDDSVSLSAAEDTAADPAARDSGSRSEGGGARSMYTVRAVLFGTDGAALVLGQTGGGLTGWLWTGEDELVLPTVTLSPTPDGSGWTVEAGGGTPLSGNLRMLDEEPLPMSPRMVRGTIRFGGSEVELHGVLRPAPPTD